MVPLKWQPERKKKEGRPETTWRRSVEKQRTEEWTSWAKATAQHKTGLIGEPNVRLKAPICMEGTK